MTLYVGRYLCYVVLYIPDYAYYHKNTEGRLLKYSYATKSLERLVQGGGKEMLEVVVVLSNARWKTETECIYGDSTSRSPQVHEQRWTSALTHVRSWRGNARGRGGPERCKVEDSERKDSAVEAMADWW